VRTERGSLSFVNTIEELLRRKSSGCGQENRVYGRKDLPHRLRDNLYQQKLALTSLTSGGSSVGIVRSRTEATELLLLRLLFTHESWHFRAHNNFSFPPQLIQLYRESYLKRELRVRISFRVRTFLTQAIRGFIGSSKEIPRWCLNIGSLSLPSVSFLINYLLSSIIRRCYLELLEASLNKLKAKIQTEFLKIKK
jgi:hypothetical protein